MKKSKETQILACLVLAAIGSFWMAGDARAQVKSYTPGEYAVPIDPPFKADATVDELLPLARVLVRKPALRQPLEPGYGVKPGERIAIVVSSNFDNRVLEAIRRAIEEVGGKPDIVKTYTVPRAQVHGNEGHNEIRLMSSMMGGGPRFGFPKALQALGKYDMVINGSGGPVPVTPYKWEYIPWETVDMFMFSQAGFPYEVQKAIDDKAWDMLLKSTHIRATDPEGTDMNWDWQAKYAAMLREEWPGYAVVLTGHLGSFPEFLSPLDANANGIIAGTINHTGSFPRLALTIKKNEIVKVEGGGEYGKKWQEMLNACRGVQYPGFPAPGCGWFEEAAVGSDVWRSRALDYTETNAHASWERGRAGVIHWGLGVSRNVDALPAVQKWLEDNKNPANGGHWHVHTYFTTMDFTENDGKVVRLIDKGHLTLLDDPDVRKLAAKYGNPDEILKVKWVPEMPGINMPGNYLADYAPDPFKVIAPHQAELMKKAHLASSQPASVKSEASLEAKTR
jgi:hypothetical protein